MTAESKGTLPAVDLPYTGGKPALGSHLTAETLKAIGRPLPQAAPADIDEAPAFSEDCP